MTKQIQKQFNATREGQIALCNDATSISVALMLNRKIRENGGQGWDPSFIESANPVLLVSIKNDLILEWNSLVKKTD